MRKRYFIFCLLSMFSFSILAAEVERITLKDAKGKDREYFKYVPESYDGSTPYGVLLCLHGFGQSGESFFTSFKLHTLLNESKFIIIAPSALPEQDNEVINQMQTYAPQFPLNALWGTNMGMKVKVYNVPFGEMVLEEWTVLDAVFNKDVDDSAFLTQILDEISSSYNISSKDVFIFGTSMGGYLAYQYALRNYSKLAGVISFNATMSEKMTNRTSGRVNLCDFHSEDDDVVPYKGSYGITVPYEESTLEAEVFMGDAKEDVIAMWVSKNRIETDPIITNYEDVNSTGKTVTKYEYEPGRVKLEVVHYKARGAKHIDFLSKANGDCIDYGEEMMSFIARNTTLVNDASSVNTIEDSSIVLTPNPAIDFIEIKGVDNKFIRASIYSISGQKIYSDIKTTKIDLSFLTQGIYVIEIKTKSGTYLRKLLKK